MNLWPFHRRKPDMSIAEAARRLGGTSHDAYRRRVRAKAREMRAAMGLPPDPALEERKP